jgi:hypothetical protein
MEKNQQQKHIVGTYPKTKGKIVETEKKNRYENQNYHTAGIHVVPKYIQKKQRQYRYLLRTLFYYCLLLSELFSYSVVWWGIVPDKGDKSWQKYKKITWENLCHRYSPCGKSFETGIVPVARYSLPLSSVLFKNSTHWLSNQNTAFSYVMY